MESKSMKISKKKLCFFFFIVLLTTFSHIAVFNGQFTGEDEVNQMKSAYKMIKYLKSFDLVSFLGILAYQNHPPLRYFLSFPGLLLFGSSETSLRLVTILISFYMIFQIIKLGEEIGNKTVGYVSGILIACSPVFNWTSMAFGWSLIVVMLIYSIRLLNQCDFNINHTKGKKAFFLINIYVIIAFLINTGTIVFFGTTLLIFFIYNLKKIPGLIKITLPFFIFYFLYYLFFLVIGPYMIYKFNGDAGPVGQLSQNLARKEMTYLNVKSFVDNIKGINAYFFPFISWIIVIASFIYLTIQKRVILIWISLYVFAWSFLILGASHQYFLLIFIALFPFGIQFIYNQIGQKKLIIAATALAISILCWNYLIFIKNYGSDDPAYPDKLFQYSYSSIGRRHNFHEPYQKIGHDIDYLLDDNQYFIHDLAGCFTRFYYNDQEIFKEHSKYAGKLKDDDYHRSGNCFKLNSTIKSDVRIIVTQKEFCKTQYLKKIQYENSLIKLYLIN